MSVYAAPEHMHDFGKPCVTPKASGVNTRDDFGLFGSSSESPNKIGKIE